MIIQRRKGPFVPGIYISKVQTTALNIALFFNQQSIGDILLTRPAKLTSTSSDWFGETKFWTLLTSPKLPFRVMNITSRLTRFTVLAGLLCVRS